MNVKKTTIIIVTILLIVQVVLMLYLNIKYNQLSGLYIDEGLRYYYMRIIFYAMLSDAVILMIGFLVYYKQLVFLSRITTIMAYLLAFSVLIMILAGLFLGVTIDTSVGTANVHENIPLFLNVFFIAYIVCFVGFMVASFLKITFLDNKPKILLTIILISNIFVYLRQSTYFEFFSSNPDAKYNMRQVIYYVLEYPLFIIAIVLSTIILVKDSTKMQKNVKEKTF
jgi:hypothetical protein